MESASSIGAVYMYMEEDIVIYVMHETILISISFTLSKTVVKKLRVYGAVFYTLKL